MDPRTAATKANIKNAFIRLAEQMPIKKISVSTLCKELGIPRQTFYYHYNNWQELIEDILDSEVAHYLSYLENKQHDLATAVRTQLEEMDKRRAFHLRLAEAGYTNLLVDKMSSCVYSVISDHWLTGVKLESTRKAQMNLHFAVSGFYSLVLDKEKEYDREELVDFVIQLLRYQHAALVE